MRFHLTTLVGVVLALSSCKSSEKGSDLANIKVSLDASVYSIRYNSSDRTFDIVESSRFGTSYVMRIQRYGVATHDPKVAIRVSSKSIADKLWRALLSTKALSEIKRVDEETLAGMRRFDNRMKCSKSSCDVLDEGASMNCTGRSCTVVPAEPLKNDEFKDITYKVYADLYYVVRAVLNRKRISFDEEGKLLDRDQQASEASLDKDQRLVAAAVILTAKAKAKRHKPFWIN